MSSVEHQAMAAIVTGAQIQKVGFRAMVQKEAIMYNLAGSARNNTDGTVSVTLQGDRSGTDQVVAAMKAGSKKSSKNNTVAVVPAQPEPNLKTFTVFNWTSTTRNIMTLYNLVFPLRPNDNQISPNEAKAVWNNIAENTLKGDDLTKFKQHLDDDSE
jgi:acylphosphatase